MNELTCWGACEYIGSLGPAQNFCGLINSC